MKDQPKDTLENLIFVNGKQEVSDYGAKKPAKKPAKKQAPKKQAPKKEIKKYSLEELKSKSSTQLTNICNQLGVPAARRKPQMIENILNSN